MGTTKTSSTLDSPDLLQTLLSAKTTAAVEKLLKEIPIVDETAYLWTDADPATGWQPGKVHWIPVGRDRGNAGRVQLAGDPYNPCAERLINGMEAIIELARQKELLDNLFAPTPQSPRDAVERYFKLPRLDLIPRTKDKDARRVLEERLREMRRQLVMRLEFDKKSKQFCVEIRDHGIGQAPERVHQTLLSLGRTDKADKPYLIGVFGQGGSSTYAASQYSIVISRRAPQFLDGKNDGIGWTIVRKIVPKGRRDPYYAYLAALPDGRVPGIELTAATASQFEPGTMFRHIAYDFGRQGSAVAMTLFYALNHVLFGPVLPYDLYALKDKPDPMHGTAYRLARQTVKLENGGKTVLDNSFQPQVVGATA
jgi:hypothetical protein